MHAPYSAVAATTNEVIHTNKKHPFFTEEQGFLPVAQLKIGMHVLRADERYGVITGYRVVPGSAVMYNLEVEQDHTFTVGSGEWVVHNCGGDVNLPEDKFKYFFGEATGSEHNLARSNELALQMKTLGVSNTLEGRTLVRENLEAAALAEDNITKAWSTQYGDYVLKESLFAGPSGRFALFRSSWRVFDDGSMLFSSLTIIGQSPYGR